MPLKIDTKVYWDIPTSKYRVYGIVVGYYAADYPIILLDSPDEEGNKAVVVYQDILTVLN